MSPSKSSGGRKQRRSQRRELALPIRVFGTSARGRDFAEDCVCVKVSSHGAQIRLKHTVIAEEAVRILNLKNNKEADFRIVELVNNPPDKPYADWGVEALRPDEDFWRV